MDRPYQLFQRLESGGVAALEQLLADAEPESLFLDFKHASTSAGDATLHRSDRENLSKALSGFANSEGGVLLWGVQYRRDPKAQRETAVKDPVGDAQGFRTLIEGAVSGESTPAHSNVRTLHIAEESGPQGYVAVLIPASLIGPLRSTRTHHYHLRSGSSFGIVPHGVLAGMFGRAPRPIVSPRLISHFAQLNERQDGISLSFGLAVGNFGAVLADKVFLSAWAGAVPPECVTVQLLHESAYVLRRGRMRGFSVVARDGVELAPGSLDELCDVVVLLPIEFGRTVEFEFTIGARDAQPIRFHIAFDGETLRTLPNRLRAGRLSTRQVWQTDAEEQN